MPYVLGVDIGSSKTHAIVADAEGRVLGAGQAGAGNYQVVGHAGMAATLREASASALAEAGIGTAEITFAALGISGYDWPSQRPQMESTIREAGIAAPLELVNDALLGLIAGAAEGWGLALVAGTGSNCRGRDRQGREGRVSGEGIVFGEFGGGSDLTFFAFQAVSRAWSRRGPPTALSAALATAVGAQSLDDLIEGVSQGRYEIEAALAPLVFASAEAGDEVARTLIARLGHELADLAIGVIRQLELEREAFEIVLLGSLYNGGPLLVEPLREAVQRVALGARLVRLSAPPVLGAALLALRHAGGVVPAARARLRDEIAARLAR
jgi:N-acetylglucosamine kinase-like BadF-type ATPase